MKEVTDKDIFDYFKVHGEAYMLVYNEIRCSCGEILGGESSLPDFKTEKGMVWLLGRVVKQGIIPIIKGAGGLWNVTLYSDAGQQCARVFDRDLPQTVRTAVAQYVKMLPKDGKDTVTDLTTDP